MSIHTVWAQVKFDVAFKTRETVFLLKTGKFETIHSRMNPEMQRIMDVDKIMGMWDLLEMGNGPLLSTGETEVSYKGKQAFATIVLKFETKQIGLRIVFDADTRIAGLYLVSPTPRYVQPDYVNPASFSEYHVTLPDPKYPIKALVTQPRKLSGMRAVIIVAGEGNSDRDFTHGPNKPFKDLAMGLAENGILVLRYEKKQSAYPALKPGTDIQTEYLNDLQNALKAVKQIPEVDSNQIFVFGHGHVATLLPFFSTKLNGVAGYVMLSSPFEIPSTPPNAESQWQARFGPAHYLDTYRSQKVLFIHGGKDLETSPAEAEKWKNAGNQNNGARWTFLVYPYLNFILMEADPADKPGQYPKANNIPLNLITELATFILN